MKDFIELTTHPQDPLNRVSYVRHWDILAFRPAAGDDGALYTVIAVRDVPHPVNVKETTGEVMDLIDKAIGL